MVYAHAKDVLAGMCLTHACIPAMCVPAKTLLIFVQQGPADACGYIISHQLSITPVKAPT